MRSTLLVPLALALTLPLAPVFAQETAQTPAPLEAVIELEAGEHTAEDVVERWAEAANLTASLDPQVSTVRIHLDRAVRLDGATLERLLDANDVVVVIEDELLKAYHRRNLAQHEGPPWTPLLAPDAPADPHHRIVTAVVPVRHGAGNAIFATVRGLLTRDPNRVGNILYVQGSEQIILVDFGPKVAYYRQVIAALDVPPPSLTLQVSAYLLPRDAWQPLEGLAPAERIARLQALATAGEAELLQEARVPTRDGRFSLSRQQGKTAIEVRLGFSADDRTGPELELLAKLPDAAARIQSPLGPLAAGQHHTASLTLPSASPQVLVVSLSCRAD